MSTLGKRLNFTFGLVGIIALALSISGVAIASGGRGAPTPDGFDAYLVYMADGRYDPSIMGPDGDYFQKEIMGRSDAEIAQNRADAVEFFIQRFGIDPDSPAFEDDVMFGSFTFDPRNEYRAYTIAGESVPSSGWVVRDGGWSLAITNPDGLTLGGEFAGTEVPQGTMMVFGDYNIDRQGPGNSGKNSAHAEPIIIHYQSGSPIIPNADGSIMFRCELFSEDFGHGLAQGISAPQMMDDGTVQANVRNVLTFPGLGN